MDHGKEDSFGIYGKATLKLKEELVLVKAVKDELERIDGQICERNQKLEAALKIADEALTCHDLTMRRGDWIPCGGCGPCKARQKIKETLNQKQ